MIIEPNLVPEPAPILDVHAPCSRCGGDGGFEIETSINRETGGYNTIWETCTYCDGDGMDEDDKGETAGEPEPIGELIEEGAL